MFPSDNCNNNEAVYYNYSDQSGFHRPSPNDITLNSKQDDPSLSFFHSDDHDMFLQCCELLLQHQHQHQPLRPHDIIDNTTRTSLVNIVDFDPTTPQLNATPNLQIPRKRPLKKDRHSKINTARGPRDRRMRLSLEVARPFFNLQDKLGYDKASKTVEWLLIQAEPEIKKLERGLLVPEMNYSFTGTVGAKSASSTSECEVVSEINEAAIRGSCSIKSRGKPSIKGKKTRQSRKSTTLRPQTRDSREKARARARERTSYKKSMRSSNRNNNNINDHEAKNDNHSNKFCSLSVFENNNGDEHSSAAELPAAGNVRELQDLANHEYAVDDSSVILGKWSPSSIFNYSHNMGIPQEHQFADFQFFGKPYEA